MKTWALAVLGLVLVACGGAAQEGDRFDLRTPGTTTGAPLTPTPEPTATPRAATPTPTPKPRPVTSTERRIVRGWADALRRGRVQAASRYFSVPSRALNTLPGWEYLETQRDVEAFNRSLPCGAKLVKMRRSDEPKFVVGVFRLTKRPGGECGTGTGNLAAVAFRIYRDHITSWVRADDEIADPTPAPTPAPTVDPDSA